jgi:hypothetical protein
MLLGSDTVTIINNGTVAGYDSLGTATYAPVLTVVTQCSLQERQTERDETNITDVMYARFRLFAPGWAPITSTSLAVVGVFTAWPPPEGTQVWMIDGQPTVWHNRMGAVDHLECYLREQTG